MNIYKELVKTAVSDYFGDEYNDSSNDAEILGCFNWAVNIISSMLSKSGNGRKLEFSSLFRQFSISEDCNRIGEVSSSTFLGIMMENMKMSKDANVIETLASIIGASGMGFGFEYVAHQDILKSNKPYFCVPLQQSSTESSIKEIQLGNKRKVLIRSIEDIGSLRIGEYGLPTTPNFPLVDAIIPPNILLQMTTSDKHYGAVNRLSDIAKALKIQINKLIMIFVTPKESFKNFKFVDKLTNVRQQYVTLSTQSTKSVIETLRYGAKNKRKIDN